MPHFHDKEKAYEIWILRNNELRSILVTMLPIGMVLWWYSYKINMAYSSIVAQKRYTFYGCLLLKFRIIIQIALGSYFCTYDFVIMVIRCFVL